MTRYLIGLLVVRVIWIAVVMLAVVAGPVYAADKQVGSFLGEHNARGLVAKLQAEGRDAYIAPEKIKGKLFYIVFVREGALFPKTKPEPLTPEPLPAPPDGIEPLEGLGRDFSLYYPNSARLYKQPSKDAPVIMSRDKAGPLSTIGASGQEWYAVRLYSTNEVLYVLRSDVIRESLKPEAPAIANAPEAPKQAEPQKKEKPAPSPAAGREVFALGGFLNPSNLSAGPMLVYKPFQNLGFEAMVGVGQFITAEARIVLKGQSRPKYNPYLGAGFLYTQAKAEVLGKQQKFSDAGYNISLGLDANYGHGWHGFMELGHNNLELKGKVTSGTKTVNAEVDHSSVTGTFGMARYF